MNGMLRIFSNFKEFYNDINGATLTGAIDVIVVEQPDGTYNCSPFHVRFGKLGVLRSKEKVVDVEVNGEPLDIHMKLGESGEAFFVEELEDDQESEIPEHLATSPIPVSEIENLYTKLRRRSFDLGLNEKNSYDRRRHTADADDQLKRTYLERDFLKRQIDLGNLDGTFVEDVTYSLTTSRPSDEDDFSRSQNDVSETIFKMDSLDEPSSKTEKAPEIAQEKSPTKSTIDELQGESKSSKKKRKKMRKKNAPRKSTSANVLTSPTVDNLDRSNDSSLGSNCSEADLKEIQLKNDNVTKDTEELTVQPDTTIKRLETDFHFFSDTELAHGNGESRAVSPVNVESVLSDSEIEMKLRVKENPDEPSKSWEWGGFPSVSQTNSPTSEVPSKEEQKSMLSSMFSFMKSKHNAQSRLEGGGIYLSEITAGGVDRQVAEIYFSQKKEKQDIDMDCESGNGSSLTQSPNSPEGCKSIDSDFDEQTKLFHTYAEHITLSLCGWEPKLSPERFNEHLVSYTDFCNNSTILEDPKLVAKINGKFYQWKVAVPMLVSMVCFGRPVMESNLDELRSTYMATPDLKDQVVAEGKNQPNKSSWWHWRSRSSRETTPAKDTVDTSKTVAAKKSTTDLLETKENAEALKKDEIETEKLLQEPPVATKGQKDDLNLQIASGSTKSPNNHRKTLRLSSKQIASLNLRDGVNEVEFSVTTAYQGTTRCQCHLYKWKWYDKIVISDIDGTITRSDVLGHILPIVGKDWAQSGVAQLFNKIKDNGYKLLYLSARAIGQAQITRDYLKSIRQGNMSMPDGPILLNPTSLITAFHREVIERKPEAFKISCMSDIKALFPTDLEPFYAGYGNRINDVWAYRAVGIPIHRIFTINPKGELKHELTQTFQSSYTNMSIIVDQMFPSRLEPANDYSQFSYWREPMPEFENLPELR